MIIQEKNGMVVAEIEVSGYYQKQEELTPLEAERVIKELRRAIDAARMKLAKRKKLGEY